MCREEIPVLLVLLRARDAARMDSLVVDIMISNMNRGWWELISFGVVVLEVSIGTGGGRRGHDSTKVRRAIAAADRGAPALKFP